MGIDSWFGDTADPQSFNKYSYVRNNPLKFVDPTGNFWRELWGAPKNMYILGKEILRGLREGPQRFQLSSEGRRAVEASEEFVGEVKPVLKFALLSAGLAAGISEGMTFASSLDVALMGTKGVENIEATIDSLSTGEDLTGRFRETLLDLGLSRVRIPLQEGVPRIGNELLDGVNFMRQRVLGLAGRGSSDGAARPEEPVGPQPRFNFGSSLEKVIVEVEEEGQRKSPGKGDRE